MFDLYCEECWAPFALWRPTAQRVLCDEHNRLHPELCWTCQQAVAAVLDPRDGYPKCGACANRALEGSR